MDTTVLVAIAVGGSAVVLALLGILLAALARSSSARTDRELEALRQRITQAESAGWLRDREFEAAVKVHARALGCMQRVQDALNQCLRAEPGKAEGEGEAMIDAISEAGRKLASTYAEVHTQLGRAERSAFHRAKELSLEVLYRVRTAFESEADPARIAPAHREGLGEMRTELAELQQILRDERTERIVRRVVEQQPGSETEP